MVRFLFLFATGTGGGFVRTQRTPPPYGPARDYGKFMVGNREAKKL